MINSKLFSIFSFGIILSLFVGCSTASYEKGQNETINSSVNEVNNTSIENSFSNNQEKEFTIVVINSTSQEIPEITINRTKTGLMPNGNFSNVIASWQCLWSEDHNFVGKPGGTIIKSFKTSEIPQEIGIWNDHLAGRGPAPFLDWPKDIRFIKIEVAGSNRNNLALTIVESY